MIKDTIRSTNHPYRMSLTCSSNNSNKHLKINTSNNTHLILIPMTPLPVNPACSLPLQWLATKFNSQAPTTTGTPMPRCQNHQFRCPMRYPIDRDSMRTTLALMLRLNIRHTSSSHRIRTIRRLKRPMNPPRRLPPRRTPKRAAMLKALAGFRGSN